MAKAKKRPVAVFSAPRRIGDFIVRTSSIATDINDNAGTFVTPAPTVTVVRANITALVTAENAAKSRIIGAAALRDVSYNTVLDNMRAWLAYVQLLADAEADITTAESIILLSGFTLKGRTATVKPPLKATPGKVVGTVKLIAKAVTGTKKVTYHWQKSTDGATWVSLPDTFVANNLVSGLATGTYYFRISSTTPAGDSAWSEAVHTYVL